MSSFLSASNIFLIFFLVRPSRWFLIRDCGFREHLSRALPTENIFFLLRSIRTEHLIPKYLAGLIDTLEIIIEWLQVSVSEYATDKYLRLKL